MKTCPNCHNQSADDTHSCPVCGTALDALTPPPADYFQKKEPIRMPELIPADPAPDPHDHTEEFDPFDIQEARLACMCAYLLGVPGIIIALLMCPHSGYARFHIRQALKLTVLETLTGLVSVILCWTFIIPILGALLLLVLFVVRFLCFADVCKSSAKDAPLLRNLKL